jgi:hypothetical protein
VVLPTEITAVEPEIVILLEFEIRVLPVDEVRIPLVVRYGTGKGDSRPARGTATLEFGFEPARQFLQSPKFCIE